MNPCRSCKNLELVPILSLGDQPHCNAFLRPQQLQEREQRWPLELEAQSILRASLEDGIRKDAQPWQKRGPGQARFEARSAIAQSTSIPTGQ